MAQPQAQLRIFSYLPNPRIWKATIAARLCDVAVEVRGAAGGELTDWLWDFDARPLTAAERADPGDLQRQGRTGFQGRLYKTDAFLDAHPFGTVPAAFSSDGQTGIFESNSIMRAVGRLGQARYPVYGKDAYAAARIDSFLDASLVFARDTQIYLLALGGDVSAEVHGRARDAFQTYLGGIERALAGRREYLVGDGITLADICFVAELTLFSTERARRPRLAELGLEPVYPDDVERGYPGALALYTRLCAHPAFAPDVGPYLERLERRLARDRGAA